MKRAFAIVWAELKIFFGRLELVPVVVFLTAGLSLWIYDYYGSNSFFSSVLHGRVITLDAKDIDAGGYFYWFGAAFLLLLVLPQAVMALTRRLDPEGSPTTLGWGLGDWKFGLTCCAIFYAVMVAILAVVVWTGDFQEYYPLYDHADRTLRMLIAYELAYALYFVAWEYHFRGFMTFGLEKSLGIWTIFVQMLPFTIMHFGKPSLEAMSSIFGGIALGYLALRTRSFWYGVFIHAATAVTLDLMVLALKHYGG